MADLGGLIEDIDEKLPCFSEEEEVEEDTPILNKWSMP
jgi:hypothetical protein